MAKVFIEPVGVTLEIGEEQDLLTALLAAGIAIPSDCAGRGTCGKCLVRLGSGELSEVTEVESKRLPANLREDGWRLACQARPVSARVSIEVRQAGGRRRILTASKLHHGRAKTAVVRRLMELPPATLEDKRADQERLLAVCVACGDGRQAALGATRELPDLLRRHGWRAMVTSYDGRVIDAEPPEVQAVAYGAAVDIGTSKVIAYLFDLEAGRLVDQEATENPQMRYGEDVISRIARAVDADGARELATAVRDGINQVLGELCERNGVDPRHIYDMTVVGNTAMHHLALGLSPVGLGSAPFAPAVADPLTLRAAELGLAMNPEGGVHFPPPIAGFVGSDALAVVAATRLASKRRPCLAVDIGTNTEIAVALDGRVTATSCASGPAFEGYQITHGMKAVAGAIERVRIDDAGLPVEVATIGNQPALGLCGSGVVDLLAGLVASGVVDHTGRMQPHELVRRGENGLEYLLTEGAIGPIVFTQHDVRALQLAKGAIASGWLLLLEKLALEPGDLHRVYVAGAFGNYLDVGAALRLDLLPPVSRDRVAFVGNAAGVGAQMALIDVGARRRMAALRARIEFLDLATDARFNEVFTRRLQFAPRA
ncbi:MAG: DUF4445 domain-containing protein [Thermoleophilia bacterium]|nr:DUF4445 domain-containing protein [Thermoleophilia bacterium]